MTAPLTFEGVGCIVKEGDHRIYPGPVTQFSVKTQNRVLFVKHKIRGFFYAECDLTTAQSVFSCRVLRLHGLI